MAAATVNAQGNQVSLKWEVAQKLADQIPTDGTDGKPIYEHALKTVLDKVFVKIEELTNRPIAKPLKDKVWAAFSKEHLEPLKAKLIQEYCDKFFGNVTDQQALEQFEANRFNPNDANSALHQITVAVIKTSESQMLAYLPEIAEALNKENK